MNEIRFGSQICGELTSAASREWLVPDGLGGYAMGTVGGLRTRRYHGLLVVPGETPASRKVGLASLDPAVLLPSGARVRLGAHEWISGDVDPRGFELLERFDLTDGLPRWRWRIGDVVIERELAMLHGRSCVAVVHRLISGGPVELELAAAGTWRDAHGERRADGPPLRMDPVDGGAVIEGAYRLAGPGWTPQGHWWRGAYYREEAARGLHPEEDLWYAGQFRDTLRRPGDTVSVLAWAQDPAPAPPPATEVVAAARRRNREVVASAKPADDVEATLALAADAFIVRTNDAPVEVVAGYPWFGAWSRDTMISYEGLFLRTGRADLGRELLRSYAATLSEGMLANTADTGRVEYNTVDGTLWFLHAVSRHVTVTGDTDLGDELLPALQSVVDAHLAGTRYGIGVDLADGLLTAGAVGAALTWMDARVYGVPVTPRHGKPVEVNALWINGLAGVAELAELAGRDADGLHRLHDRATKAFRDRFPTPAGWLHDVVDAPAPAYPLGGAAFHDDDLLRPNQLLAWSLPNAPLEPDPVVLGRVGAGLLTPLGPRSLSADCPGFTGRHSGGPAERDSAYHQGTVWPWLIGPYADASRRAGLPVDDLFVGLEAHLTEYGLGSVSETADGLAPHTATGCPFQAWSVAELLRARR
ncbi:amylo-alpha-1,6-glucosidase [Micromonospora endophytica]|uniref:Amylo-alpha-1,6-glucosidase n=1 Tax=Micromonospora endophytica TaxID=515350 RepID=A0A2W2D8P6_9ACTN|nr:amylo-alpha-1,6-glucosidase [Micromonospora endophytica]PZF88873.1 amylo-alpha-1,6-glucosidase [Micromonospora endophytica]RIW40466.1 amylo-alpha-1,6-glucosidase [Micromonospora endophytica]BCJ61486.1 glycogen debranching protein [Micromonospora endophytica]